MTKKEEHTTYIGRVCELNTFKNHFIYTQTTMLT